MYEQFRDDVMKKLFGKCDREQMEIFLQAMDKAAQGYSIGRVETALAVPGRRELMDLVQLYIVVKQSEGGSPNTAKLHKKVLGAFAMRNVQPVTKINANNLRAYLFTIKQERGISDRSLETYRTVLCSFFKWLYAEGHIETDITANIRKIKCEKAKIAALDQMELERLRAACKDDRDRCLVEVLYSTGCRVSEVVGIRLEDIDWKTGSAVVLGKGNKHRTVYFNAKALYAMDVYLKERRPGGGFLIESRDANPMRPGNVEKIFRRLKAAAGIDHRLTPHVMRHTMATQAATVCPIQQVQMLLGHESINTTMIYAETNAEQARAGHRLAVI